MDAAPWDCDALCSDGTTIHLRLARQSDTDAVNDLYARLSEASRRLRFFTTTTSERAASFERLDRLETGRHVVVVAERRGRLEAIASFDRVDPETAEVAFAVGDASQGLGLGSLLLEHLAAIARSVGIRRFVAYVLADNEHMLHVFLHTGFVVERRLDAPGTLEVSFDISATAASQRAQDEREHVAETRSITPLLAPHAIAVIGAGTDGTSLDRLVRDRLLAGGFRGPVYAVNRSVSETGGGGAYATIRDVPGPVDLAVVTVPGPEVLGVAAACAEQRVRGLLVLSDGFAERGAVGAAAQHDLVALARRHGMRLVGPGSLGIRNNDPEVRMDASLFSGTSRTGRMAVATQSGSVGVLLADADGALGGGVSAFVSLGNKADVSSNDLLQFWRDDPGTDVVVLYLESFGNPRKFARLARDVSRRKPVVALKAGHNVAEPQPESSRTAALATSDRAVNALLDASGVVRVASLEQLADTASLLVGQPSAMGRGVAIVANGSGPAVVAVDACQAAHLRVPSLDEATQSLLRTLAPPGASVANPVHLLASADDHRYTAALAAVLADDRVDAVIVVHAPSSAVTTDGVGAAVVAAARRSPTKPVLLCLLGVTDPTRPAYGEDGTYRHLPVYPVPERAVDALAGAVRRTEWLQRPPGTVPQLTDIDPRAARALIAEVLVEAPEGRRLDAGTARRVLTSFGIPVLETTLVPDAQGAAAEAERIGFPVALKAANPDIAHKADVGGVRLGLTSAGGVREAFLAMRDALGVAMGGALVQPMAAVGVDVIVGVKRHAGLGPIVLLGAGGMTAELTPDSTVALAPLSDVDARDLIRGLRSSSLLFGYRGTPAVAVDALEDVLLRVGLLADAVPEIDELDCNPVVVGPDGASVVDIRLHVAPIAPALPAGLRTMRPA